MAVARCPEPGGTRAPGPLGPHVPTPVAHAHPGHYTVPAGWPHTPAGLQPGDSFRLLFVTSTKRNTEPKDIAYYNEFVERAADKNPNLEPYQFRALGSTADVDARDNTNTAAGEGMPIYWVGGDKVADDYADFYDGTWDSYVAKDEQGNTVPPDGLRVSTGSNNDGTKKMHLGVRYAMGDRPGSASGRLESGKVLDIGSHVAPWSNHYRFYALSPVLTVAATPTPTATPTPAPTPPPPPGPTATPTPTPTPTPAPTATPTPTPLAAVKLWASPFNISEDGGVSTIRATLDDPAPETITITISAVEEDSGQVKADLFTLSANRTLTIAAGETTSTGVVTVTAVDNTRTGSACCTWEDEEDVVVSGTATGGRPVSDAWVFIRDDEQAGGL